MMPTDPTTPTTEAGLQRYSLVIEQDDSAYLELDPAGHWCIADDAEDAVAQARADERRRLAGLVDAALTDEDEIGHGEAVVERGGRRIEMNVCAYCQSEWPCRTQRGIDRLLAVFDTEPAP